MDNSHKLKRLLCQKSPALRQSPFEPIKIIYRLLPRLLGAA